MLKDKKKQINFSRVRIVFIDCFILYGIDIKKKNRTYLVNVGQPMF